MVKISDMNYINKKELGDLGESFIIKRLTDKGFCLFKRNIRQWGSEIDLVVYKFSDASSYIDIRIVEVKTRLSDSGKCIDILEGYDLEGKWRRVRKRMFSIKEEIMSMFAQDNLLKSSVHFDLAIVVLSPSIMRMGCGEVQNHLRIHTYIKDINLFI